MPFKDECGICGRVFPYSYLRRCQRCGRLFCRDCMVPDVSTGDPTRMLCLSCARRIVSPRSVSKYDPLKRYLRFRASFTDVVKLSFAKIDGIIGDNLPMSAFRNEKWWSNSSSSVHAKAWLDAGWRMQEVNLDEGCVVFQKVKSLRTKSRRKKRSREKVKKPFTPAPYRIPRTRKTSKTKAAKLYARLKNLERKRASPTKYRGSFKPKPAKEKRLYKPEEKPK
ncbi:MAG: FYVE zinc finger domain-containing protein [Candidatus Bathyarchaeota archaeon]|nr:FYVE zinc finger domain-containing protein [Candidatus Bathyarchaeota archaeon]MDH5532593.1 FYVE zinc finger domain-containing protein [Candidatus Bathyarchaeota archaeon]MDH5747069.1 FYVE zinc finger domain-containing protein [Candidatus Bathyarchaeota archaeon]